jgi:ribosomal protein L40E
MANFMMDESLVQTQVYEIKLVLDEDPNHPIECKLTIIPVEIGNRVEIRKKENDSLILLIDIKNIKEIEKVSVGKGFLKKGGDGLKMIFDDGTGKIRNVTVLLDENSIKEIGDNIAGMAKIENTFELFQGIGLFERDNEVGFVQYAMSLPILADGEEILWERTKLDGTIHKHIHALEVITNYRVAFFDFNTHQSLVEMLIGFEIVVTNQKGYSQSYRQGNFTGRSVGGGGFFGTSQGFSSSTSETIGDVILMDEGKVAFTIYQVSDPHGVARLLKIIMDSAESLDARRMAKAKQKNSDLKGEQTCIKCGQVNPSSSKFCNKCGAKIVSACEKCGQINPDGASFCNKCGFTLK